MLGPGGFYSVNYERVTPEKVVLRGGISYVNFDDGFFNVEGFTFPLSISTLLTIDEDSFVEIGAFTTKSTLDDSDVWIGPSMGFREQSLIKSRVVVKLFLSPFYTINGNDFIPMGGLSFGKSF